MRLGERGQSENRGARRPCGGGGWTSRHPEGARVRLLRECTFARQEIGRAPCPRDPSDSRGQSPDRPALRATPRAPWPRGSTAGGAGEVARDAPRARGPWSTQPPRRRHRPGRRSGTRDAAHRLGRAASGPLAVRGRVGGGPTVLGGNLAVLGARRSRALTCSWRWAARGAWAAGRRGTVPRRPGPAAPAPSARERGAGAVSAATFCARRARPAGRIRSAWVGAGAGRLRAAGARPGEGRRLGLFAAPQLALRGRPLLLLAPTSSFPPRAPALLLGPSMTHRSPRVPPSLFHFPLRNVTLPPPRLSPVLLLLGRGFGVKGL